MGPKLEDPGLNFSSPLILRHGGLKSSTTTNIVVSNTSGRNWVSLNTLKRFTDAANSLYWGTTKWTWDLAKGSKEDGAKVRSSQVLRNYN